MSNKGFTIKSKKTPFQRHKELEEEKKRRADEEAAKIYEEFVESFKTEEEEDNRGVKAFVRGGTVQPGSRSHEASGNKGSKYVPSYVPAALGGGSSAGRAGRPEPGRVQQRHDAFAEDEEEEESVFKLPAKKQDKDKPRQIDKMLEELKREQEEREERDRLRREGKPLPPELMRSSSEYDDPDRDRDRSHRGDARDHRDDRDKGLSAWDNRGSFDEGDPYTTNLYVGNIHPEVNEAHLAREFGRFGPIGSVKIMWPRDEEQRRRGRNCGFVAFMKRADAEAGLKALDGLVLHGMEMKIGWGKAVPLPPVPLYSGHGVPTGPLTAIVPPAVTRDRNNPLTLAMQSALVPAQGMFAKESTQSRTVVKGVGADIEVKVPETVQQRFVIDSLALYVLKDGCEFEQLVMMEQQDNPQFAFLFDLDSSDHAYYRWRLYSLAEGDTLRTWRIDPYLMVESGQAWLPPPMLAADIEAGTKRLETTRSQQQVLLSDADRDKLEDMLRGLTAERQAIAEAMLFALDNADAAADVVEVLEESLTLPETPPATKLARLFLVNDILHNSTAPVRNASRYRSRLEAALPEVLMSFHGTYKSADSRMIQEALKRAVLRLLRVWRERFIFNDDYINGLQATFLGQIPILEEAEEEELQRQAAAEAAAVRAAAAAENAQQKQQQQQQPQAAKSRWEESDDEEDQQPGLVTPADGVDFAARSVQPARVRVTGLNPALEEQLEKLTDEELERRCRVNGLSNKGSRQLRVERLLALDCYVHGGVDNRSAGAASAAAAPAAVTNPSGFAVPGSAAAVDHSSGSIGKWGGTIRLDLKPEPDLDTAGPTPQQPQQLVRGMMAAGEGAAVAGAPSPVPPAAAALAASRWQEVDEDAEKEAQLNVPVSKWILEAEAEATRKADEARRLEEEAAAATAAAAAAAAAKEAAARAAIAARQHSTAAGALDGDMVSLAAAGSADRGAATAAGTGTVPGTAAAAGGKSAEELAFEEQRRKKLRQIEVQVLDHQEELQEKGCSVAEAEAAAAALRQQLVAALDADMASAVATPAGKESSASDRRGRSSVLRAGRDKSGSSKGADRERSKEQDRDRDRDKEREKERDSRRSERKRSRSRSRSRGQGRDSTGGGSSRQQLSRGASDKERSKEKQSSRDKDRDRDRDRSSRSEKRSRRSRSRSRSRGRSRSRSRSSSRDRRRRR